MSQAHKCFGAGGLSFLLASWTLDLKMLAPFILGKQGDANMETTVIQDKALQKIKAIHQLSDRYNKSLPDNARPNNHSLKLIELIKEHSNEIKELFVEGNKHYLIEAGDLIMLCFELILENHASINEILSRCFERYEIKLTELLRETSK
jgi:hypothetical protein